jgi:transcriptional regulator with XRE-family HTH domain
MIGEELRTAREAAGLTQEELAFKAGVDRSYISLLENDRKSPTLDMLFRICKALGASLAVMITNIENKQRSGGRRQ